jgi:DNA-binding NarL/FixJ family response regulator
MKPLRILIADDHDLMRHGIKNMLQSRPDWEICGEAHNGDEAIALTRNLKPDIAILDINMPNLNGLEAAKRIGKESPNTEVLILSLYSSDELTREIINVGAKGYILKSDSDRDLILAIETLARHKPFLTACAADLMLFNFNNGEPAGPNEPLRDRLTTREREILRLLAEGKSSKEAAEALFISIKTVETHRSNIMRKLDTHSTSELVRYAVRNQIIEP